MDYPIGKMVHLSLLLVSVFSQDVFNTMPPPVNTNFSCRGRDTGFYADVETNCRVYHTCDDHGNKFTYYCPAETAFRQEALVCDHAHLVDCARGRRVSNLRSEDEAREGNADARAANDAAGSLANRKSSNADAALGEARHTGRSLDIFQSANSNPSYTRSFRITAEPHSQSSTPKSFKRKQPTFVLSSSVFLRDRVNFQKTSPGSQNNRVATESSKTFGNPSDYQARKSDKKEEEEEFFARTSGSMTSTTTFGPFGADFNVTGNFRSPGLGNNEDKTGGFFGKFPSSIPSTTFKPSGTDFKVKDDTAEVTRNAQNPSGLQIRRLDTDESVDRFPASKLSASKTTTTFRPFGAGFKVKPGTGDVAVFGKTKFEYQDDGKSDGSTGSGMKFDEEEVNGRKTGDDFRFESQGRNDERGGSADKFGAAGVEKDSGKSKTLANERPFFVDGSNFPYYETLRSMQAGSNKSSPPNSSTVRSFVSATTSAPVVTAGTEFPVHAFTGSLSPLIPNELEDDPYYPRRSTTTEVYYKLSDRDKIGNKLFRFSTRRPWPGSLDFEIPEVLPDLNTLDDLVDRRKHFYIPRVKAT